MPDPADTTLHAMWEGKALVRAIEALTTIDCTGWLETGQSRLLPTGYKRRRRALVVLMPAWVVEESPVADDFGCSDVNNRHSPGLCEATPVPSPPRAPL